MFNVSFIGICVKKDSTSKLTSRSVGRSRIFCIKSVELVICDSDFPGRSCSVCARKRDKLYVGEWIVIIGLRGCLCTFFLVVLVGEDL